MNELINEKVSVVTIYGRERGCVMPVKIRWQGRVHMVRKVGLHYVAREGRKLVHYFSVITDNNTSFKLKHDTETLQWILEEVIDEFAN